jgi:hypothetical protein
MCYLRQFPNSAVTGFCEKLCHHFCFYLHIALVGSFAIAVVVTVAILVCFSHSAFEVIIVLVFDLIATELPQLLRNLLGLSYLFEVRCFRFVGHLIMEFLYFGHSKLHGSLC